MTKIIIFIIRIYQYAISPFLGNRCRFLPTCSEYFVEALNTQGLIKGLILGVKRILKCHPFKKLGSSYGLDFVPIPKTVNRKQRLNKIVEGLQQVGWKFEDKKKRQKWIEMFL